MITQDRFPSAISDPIFKTIGEAAAELGMDAYVIGGYVRDFFLKRDQKKDIDIVTVGSGISLSRKLSKKLSPSPKVQVFKNFGTAMIRHGELELEFVGARRESYQRDSRKPIVEDGTLIDDQNRRDFTINALAFSLQNDSFGKLLDPFNGIQDLRDRVIRTPMDPDQTYSDDPLRMLRAIRFAAQLDFKIEDSSFNGIKNNAERIEIVSHERIVTELHKIMETPVPSKGFLLLEETGLLELILPELVRLKGVEEIEGERHKDNFYHTLEVVDNISQHTNDLWLRWAALLHDIGKAPTKKFDKKIGWTFHGHEFKGSKMVYHLFKRLRMPLNDKMKFVQKMVRMSSRPIAVISDDATDSAVRRLIHDAGEHIDDLMTLCEADITTKNPKKFKRYHRNFQKVRDKIEEVEARDQVRNFQPPVDGQEIMDYFGIPPCREIGQIKSTIKEAILNGDIPNEHDAAFELMKNTGAALGLTPSNQ